MSVFGGTKKISTLTGPQTTLLNNLSGILNQQVGQAGPQYTGPVNPVNSAAQQAAYQYAPNMLTNMPDLNPQISSMLGGQSANGLNPQQYAQQAIIDPAKLAYADAQRELEAKYGGTWGQTGGYQDIMQENAARFGTGLSQTLADFARYNQDTGNQQRQAGIEATFGNQNNIGNILNQMMGIGGEERAQSAQENLEAYNQWSQQQAYNNPWLGLLGPTLGTQAFGIGQEQGLLGKSQGVRSAFSPLK